MNDLSSNLQRQNAGCFVNGVMLNYLFYADDSVLIAPSPCALQKLINVCQDYATDNYIKYKTVKTVCMAILPKDLSKCNLPSVYLMDKPLAWMDVHKYLGVFLSSDRNDQRDITRQL